MEAPGAQIGKSRLYHLRRVPTPHTHLHKYSGKGMKSAPLLPTDTTHSLKHCSLFGRRMGCTWHTLLLWVLLKCCSLEVVLNRPWKRNTEGGTWLRKMSQRAQPEVPGYQQGWVKRRFVKWSLIESGRNLCEASTAFASGSGLSNFHIRL